MKENQLNNDKVVEDKFQINNQINPKKCCGDCKNNGNCNDNKKEHTTPIKK